jgi:hypothetical protein
VRDVRDLRILLSVFVLRHRRRLLRLHRPLFQSALGTFVNSVPDRCRGSCAAKLPIVPLSRTRRHRRCPRSSLPGSIRARLFRALYRWRMSTSDAPLSSTIPASTLDEAARGFVASPRFSRQLESKRNAVLTLRAKDASYTQIQDLLKVYGIEVPESAVARFCRKYRGQIQRLRLNLEQETDSLDASPAPRTTTFVPTVTPNPNPIASPTRRLRDLRGPV